MSLFSFLTGAASLFGSSGGTNSSSNSKSTSTTTSSGTSEQAATASEEKSGTTTQAQTSTGTSNSTGSTSQTGTTTGNEASQTSGTTTNYSSDILASLDSLLKQQLGTGTGVSSAQQASDALAGRLKQLQETAAKPAFDVDGYVSGITEAAASATQNDLDSRINSILSATGSSEGGNSMSALLGNKLRNDAAANLAGVAANARATGEGIKTQQETALTSQISGLSGDLMTNLSNLLAAAKGGTQTTTGAATTSSTQQQQQAGTSQSSTTENLASNTTQTEQSKTEQTGLTQTKANQTSTTSTKGSSSGTTGGKDLFGRIFDALGQSATAA